MHCYLLSLPNEVLVYILSFLRRHDKLNISSTCKHLMNLMNHHPGLFEDVQVDFRQSTLEFSLPTFSTMIRNFCNFNFFSINIKSEVFCFIKKFALQFRRLHFKHCYMSVEDVELFRGKIKNCNNLLELRVWDIRSFSMFSNLPKLEYLYINETNILSDGDWAHIQSITPVTLRHLGMELNYMGDTIRHQFLEDFIQKRHWTFQSLNLGGTKIKSEHIVKLSKIECLKLKCIQLSSSYDLQSVISLCYNQPTIVTLNLSCIGNIDDITVATICNTLPHLEKLILHSEENFDKNVAMIFQLKCLRWLDLSHCRRIRLDSFLKALDGFSCYNLKHLNLSRTEIDDTFMSRLAPLISNLRELILHFCSKITDLTVFAISRCLTSLRLLELSSSTKITNNGLLGRMEGLECPPIPLSNIKGLEVLDLCGCKQLTEEGLIKAIRFDWLISLNLRWCVIITRSGRVALKEGNPKLRILINRYGNELINIAQVGQQKKATAKLMFHTAPTERRSIQKLL